MKPNLFIWHVAHTHDKRRCFMGGLMRGFFSFLLVDCIVLYLSGCSVIFLASAKASDDRVWCAWLWFCHLFSLSSQGEHVIIIHPSKRHWKLFIHENNDVKGKRIIVTWLPEEKLKAFSITTLSLPPVVDAVYVCCCRVVLKLKCHHHLAPPLPPSWYNFLSWLDFFFFFCVILPSRSFLHTQHSHFNVSETCQWRENV